MSVIIKGDDYLDNDVAYLLGMILIRGTFHVDGDIRRLIIQFPYKKAELKAISGDKTEKRENSIKLSLEDTRNRIQELLEVDLQTKTYPHEVQLVAVFTRNTMSWRNLRTLLGHRSSYAEFAVPDVLFEAPEDIQKEFLRGIADVASNPNKADADDRIGAQRIVLEFQHSNWLLPIQVCRLLQEKLGIMVSHILWGHPNIRAPGGGTGWAKEHRLRIFADEFLPIGYNFSYKQKMLEELADLNRKRRNLAPAKFCIPKIKKIRGKAKPKHKDEKNRSLPKILRNHFDAYFQICLKLGCQQGCPSNQIQMFEDNDEY